VLGGHSLGTLSLPLLGEETVVRARAGAGAAAGAIGAAAGKRRGEVHGKDIRMQMSIVVVRELSSAAEGAAGVGRRGGCGGCSPQRWAGRSTRGRTSAPRKGGPCTGDCRGRLGPVEGLYFNSTELT
jgi:hypothetical protein